MNRAISWRSGEKPDSVHTFVGRLTRTPQRPRAIQLIRTAVITSAILAGLAAAAWLWLRSNDTAAVTATSESLLAALQAGRNAAATPVLASSANGAKLLKKDEVRTLIHGLPPHPDSPNPLAATPLSRIRAALAKDGVVWNAIQPLAFGGVRAQVLDPTTMRAYATIITGELFFASAAAIYGIEYTARKCGHTFIITDIWRYHRLNLLRNQLAAYSSRKFREFTNQAPDPKDPTKIRKAKPLFVAF